MSRGLSGFAAQRVAPRQIFGGLRGMQGQRMTGQKKPMRFLLVAAGGDGGRPAVGLGGRGAGGGGGDVWAFEIENIRPGIYPAAIGARVAHANGQNSTFMGRTCLGGGLGGDPLTNGSSGGSGGGGGDDDSGVAHPGGAAIGRGFPGGNGGPSDVNAGGGGGMTEAGAISAIGGRGGEGFASTITGVRRVYGSGGGAQGWPGGTHAASGESPGTLAAPNQGGGGGGGDSSGTGVGPAAANGGLFVSYRTGDYTATGGTVTYAGENTIHTLASSGDFKVLG